MFYQNILETKTQQNSLLKEDLPFSHFPDKSHIYQQLLEFKLIVQNSIREQIKLKNKVKKIKFESKNSIWDTTKLIERFSKPEYQTQESRIKLLVSDAIHHAKEMAVVETITNTSYWHSVDNNETIGDGYSEDITLMLNAFTQDLAEKKLSTSRANIEAIIFEKAKKFLTQIAILDSKDGVLITSFPDDKKSGYHGVDSKYNWDTPESHHSFFYLLRVGKVDKDFSGKIIRFEIKSTQYRLWPNARQVLKLHEQLGQPIRQFDAPIPNLFFANLIHLNKEVLQKITSQLKPNKLELPTNKDESELENLLKQILYANADKHKINFSHSPIIPEENFWSTFFGIPKTKKNSNLQTNEFDEIFLEIKNSKESNYFRDFYLASTIPVFEKAIMLNEQLKSANSKQEIKKIRVQIQREIQFLDKAFFYYSKTLLGFIKLHNTNPKFESKFKEKNQVKVLIEFQQKMILRLLGQKQHNQLPSISNLRTALNIDHRLATNQQVSSSEKKLLLNVWGFFSFAGRISSLLQCGTIAPFTAPISIMKGLKFGLPGNEVNLNSFGQTISSMTIPEQKQLLTAFEHEDYVELDLTKAKPFSAKKIYSVPKSYLEGNGCVVDKNGNVLGPCLETVIKDGKKFKKRIPLDDPRDTMAFPMTLEEFKKYINKLQKNITKKTLTQIEEVFQDSGFSDEEKIKVSKAIKKIEKKLIKKTLGLQEFITGNVTKEGVNPDNEWLQELIIKISFSINPVNTLVQEVEKKLRENDPVIDELTQDKNG